MSYSLGLIFIIGFIVGIMMEKATLVLIRRRTEIRIQLDNNRDFIEVGSWGVVNALSWLLIISSMGVNSKSIEVILFISVCIVLSTIDARIQKIPNELIVLTLVIGGSFLIIEYGVRSIETNIVGLLVGFIIFLLPAFIGKAAGWGDVKYAAAIGFCLGIYGFLTAILVMTSLLLMYTGYIYITGKGNLKTKIALGPFMAFGFISVLLFNSQYYLFDLSRIL
jgi:prepilin signal peptidase PulO-like enzyme (type II secretory pathway)